MSEDMWWIWNTSERALLNFQATYTSNMLTRYHLHEGLYYWLGKTTRYENYIYDSNLTSLINTNRWREERMSKDFSVLTLFFSSNDAHFYNNSPSFEIYFKFTKTNNLQSCICSKCQLFSFFKKILNFDVQTNPLKNLFILFLTDSVYWCPRK